MCGVLIVDVDTPELENVQMGCMELVSLCISMHAITCSQATKKQTPMIQEIDKLNTTDTQDRIETTPFAGLFDTLVRYIHPRVSDVPRHQVGRVATSVANVFTTVVQRLADEGAGVGDVEKRRAGMYWVCGVVVGRVCEVAAWCCDVDEWGVVGAACFQVPLCVCSFCRDLY